MKTKSNVEKMDQAAIDAFLKKNRVGVIGLNDGSSSYSIPLAYAYDNSVIYLTMGHVGRKAGYIDKNRNVCFTVYWIPEGFGSPGKMNWTSVVCDGVLEHLEEPKAITRAVRVLEKHMGMPAGSWDGLLAMTLKNPKTSNFWKIQVTAAGGRTIENELVEFFEEG
jgi:nitroimidazol reductase NimA-like FMN-containing flavoprotein (pyridoxamine 5'-phosphate oxidase superfamily)